MSIAAVSKSIKEKALEIGFDLIGISPVDSFPENQFYKEWLARGFAGEMKYMEKEPEKRENIRKILPDARSVVSCGLNYNTNYPYSMNETDQEKGWISRYAWGDDYHDIMKKKLQILLESIKANSPQEIKARVYVDTGPVLERVYGKYSGIGWFGKNTCLINQKVGSWIFVGEIITNIELDYDNTAPDRCGTCTRCIDACPTGALLEPYVLDSRRCISYLTIEYRGMIPLEHRDKTGNNIFGCDICQDVCPWNRRAKVTDESSFKPRDGLYNPDLASLSQLTEKDFRRAFKGNPIKRAKGNGLLRNIVVAMGNSGLKDFIPYLEESLKDKDPIVRAHSAWALSKLEGEDSYNTLSNHFEVESDSIVREEIISILNMNG
ncbi:MAG TPA: tRNA epoxyqueuosine(34) reductase QueG [Thermodesulfobacteriota bacterium]|nr:tRNA epoxyqueuosine(34) reductase QueG [Thermodesulfobacteriota bacterium]